jgi:3-hydroxybutyryl-CoA dehydrogenase
LWNRLQAALLRESLAIVRSEIADPEAVDAVVREGLGRRWSTLGPFETAAAGGPQTFERLAENVFPTLSNDSTAPGLRAVLDERYQSAVDRLPSRDAALASALRP